MITKLDLVHTPLFFRDSSKVVCDFAITLRDGYAMLIDKVIQTTVSVRDVEKFRTIITFDDICIGSFEADSSLVEFMKEINHSITDLGEYTFRKLNDDCKSVLSKNKQLLNTIRTDFSQLLNTTSLVFHTGDFNQLNSLISLCNSVMNTIDDAIEKEIIFMNTNFGVCKFYFTILLETQHICNMFLEFIQSYYEFYNLSKS